MFDGDKRKGYIPGWGLGVPSNLEQEEDVRATLPWPNEEKVPPSLFYWPNEENVPEMIYNASLHHQTEMLERYVAPVSNT